MENNRLFIGIINVSDMGYGFFSIFFNMTHRIHIYILCVYNVWLMCDDIYRKCNLLKLVLMKRRKAQVVGI